MPVVNFEPGGVPLQELLSVDEVLTYASEARRLFIDFDMSQAMETAEFQGDWPKLFEATQLALSTYHNRRVNSQPYPLPVTEQITPLWSKRSPTLKSIGRQAYQGLQCTAADCMPYLQPISSLL